MKSLKKVLISLIAITFIWVSLMVKDGPIKANDAPPESLDNLELVGSDMEWRYLDDQTDPNEGTWYEGWNKRNGWAYPIGWLDWGSIPMQFDDAEWPTYTGNMFTSDQNVTDGQALNTNSDGTVGTTYFFRHTFRLTKKQAESVYAIGGKVRYNDAIIMYINGKPVESLFNIPESNYKKNLEYGASKKVTDAYIEEEFLVEDVSSILNGFVPGEYEEVVVQGTPGFQLKEPLTDAFGNTFIDITIAVELHTYDEVDTDAFFELLSFNLNPDENSLPKQPDVKNIALNVGEDENSVNFAWFSLSDQVGQLQIAEGTNTEGAFPEADAITVSAVVKEAYTKFTDQVYYSNKADFSGIEPGKDYIYRVGNEGIWSKTYLLNTTDIKDGYEVIFLSDAQIGTGTIPTDTIGWNHTLEKALGTFPNASFIANTGDFVDVATKEGEYDAYFKPDLLSKYPTATAVGNHDIAVNYGNHFNEPNASALGVSDANSDYYYIYGNVLYMVLNTSNVNHAEHLQFMDETIEATKDQQFDWKVVMFHQSIYASGKQSTSSDVPLRREAFVPKFDALGIDVVLMGHDHCYARTKQMKNFEPVKDVMYDASGAAINPEGTLYLTTSSASGSKYYDLEDEYDYLAKRAQLYVPTFSHLSITKDSFKMTAYRTDTMEIIDTYEIKKIEDNNVVDTSKLETVLAKAKAIDTTKYTEATVITLQNAINEAEAILMRKGITQEQVDTATANLRNAIDGLVLKDSENDNGSGNITPTPPSGTDTSSTKPTITGDTTNIMVWIAVFVGISAVFTVVKRRRIQ